MAGNRSRESTTALVLQIAIVALAYVVAARVGLSLDAVGGFATVVWPASGIALASLLLGGFRLWPAIAIGAGSNAPPSRMTSSTDLNPSDETRPSRTRRLKRLRNALLLMPTPR